VRQSVKLRFEDDHLAVGARAGGSTPTFAFVVVTSGRVGGM
jgi:hypothetical protein